MRIVSLLPSATEIVAALGAGHELVGRSHECDHPPGVEALPAVTEPKVDIAGPSERIDEEIRRLVEQGLSVYRVDADLLAELEPDVIVTQSQCEVCAVSEADVVHAVQEALDGRAEVVSLEPNDLGDVIDDLRRVGRALERADAGDELAADVRRRLDEIAGRSQETDRRPRVALVEWISPLMAAGNWMPELTAIAGGEVVLGEAGRHSPTVSWEELRATDPDVVVVMPCGFELDRSLEESRQLAELPGWADLRAVREGRVYATDGHRFFNRPGPRIVDSAQILAQMLHPDLHGTSRSPDDWVPIA